MASTARIFQSHLEVLDLFSAHPSSRIADGDQQIGFLFIGTKSDLASIRIFIGVVDQVAYDGDKYMWIGICLEVLVRLVGEAVSFLLHLLEEEIIYFL